jgi:histidinol-phosphate aminotransferase
VHGGINDETLLDFSISVNPFIPQFIQEALENSIKFQNRYTYVEWAEEDFKKHFGQDSVIVAGTTEALHILGWTVMKNATVVIPQPNYTEYERVASFSAKNIIKPWTFQQDEDYFAKIDKTIEKEYKQGGKIVLITGNPNNPTGSYTDFSEFSKYCMRKYGNDVLIIIDESFVDFVQPGRTQSSPPSNTILLRTFTKILGIPGVRIGYVRSNLTDLFKKYRMPWAIGGTGYSVVKSVTKNYNEYLDFVIQSAQYFEKERSKFKKLTKLESKTNYLVIEVKDADAFQIFAHANKLHVRVMKDFGMESCVRIGLRRETENDKMRKVIEEWFSHRGVVGKTVHLH